MRILGYVCVGLLANAFCRLLGVPELTDPWHWFYAVPFIFLGVLVVIGVTERMQ